MIEVGFMTNISHEPCEKNHFVEWQTSEQTPQNPFSPSERTGEVHWLDRLG